MSQHITSKDNQGIRVLCMNRPDKKNALTHDMYGALADAIEYFEQADDLQVLIIAGTSDCFTSGNDLADFLGAPPAMQGDELPPVKRFMYALLEAKKPVIAAVEGPAVGIGLTMLLHCDFAYAGKSAYLLGPFVNLALLPEYASTLLLPFAIGPKRAMEVLMLGEKLSAKKAKQFGLVNDTVMDGEALDRAMQTAIKLAAKAPEALRLTKALVKAAPESPVLRMERENEFFAIRLASDEFAEAGAAFMEKRQPDFSKCKRTS